MSPSTVELLATVLFGLAILHTFSARAFRSIAHRFPDGSVGENLFHLLGEVEIIFGFWGGVLIVSLAVLQGSPAAVSYAERMNFTEPAFVFAIMTVAATVPVTRFAGRLILVVARLIPLPREMARYLSCLVVGPLLGSFITEPAAMTVTALILKERYYDKNVSERFKYVTLAALFVNVSVGGVLTPFAAPPVLMVAGKWGWDLSFMLETFGWKAALAVTANALVAVAVLFREPRLRSLEEDAIPAGGPPAWLVVTHLLCLALVVVTAHHPVLFIGIFLFFLGIFDITREYQDELKLRQSLLVAFFLAGLVVLGHLQSWWLGPLVRSLDALPLFLGATGLTAITDNAALTYLGSQVEGVSASFKYALVSGAVAGGGLTVIANAPNPAGYSILRDSFGLDGISAFKLFVYACLPTLIVMAAFWLLP